MENIQKIIDLYGSLEEYNEIKNTQIKYFIDNNTDFKASYIIDDFRGGKDIDQAILVSGFKGEIQSFNTGKGGLELLRDTNSKYLEIAKYNKALDPIEANEMVNPLLSNLYRLSSNMFIIEIDDKLIKIIPKNPFHNYKF